MSADSTWISTNNLQSWHGGPGILRITFRFSRCYRFAYGLSIEESLNRHIYHFPSEFISRDSRRSPNGLGVRETFCQKAFTWKASFQILTDQQPEVPLLSSQPLLWAPHALSSPYATAPTGSQRDMAMEDRMIGCYLNRRLPYIDKRPSCFSTS